MTENKPIAVLLVEDDEDDFLLTRELFEELPSGAYVLERVAEYEAALEAFHKCAHDVYLVDYRLGRRDGVALVREVIAGGCAAPIIMLTGQRLREVDVAAMQAGACDFLVKDGLDSAQLERALRYAVARKRLEEEIRRANAELEARVARRTAELHRLNETLQAEVAERSRAEAALREADHRKNEFLAMLGHELRNPLSPLLAAVELIGMEARSPARVTELAGTMQRQLQQIVRLIDDLLDVSRIATGKLLLRREAVPLRHIVEGAVEATAPLLESHGHALRLQFPEREVYVHVDRVRLTQVLCNLLSNAAKYTPREGRIELRVFVEGEVVTFVVRDNGVGISRDMLQRVFELFAQLDSSTTRESNGLGIGLTLVKTLVELHGGEVEARSDGPGMGSEFMVRLPRAVVRPEEGEPNPPPEEKLSRRRILVVDDNHSAAHLLQRLLEKLDQETHTARSATEALELLPSFRPEILISDIAMPGMSGYELAARIRDEELAPRPFLVALTGYGQESDRRKALAYGFDEHLAKPVDFSTLRALLARLQTRGG